MSYWRLFPDMTLPLLVPHHRWSMDAPWRRIDEPGRISDWPALNLFAPPGSLVADCHPCIKDFAVYSHTLRSTMESMLAEEDEVQWLPVMVTQEGRLEERWVCNPLFGPEALDDERTTRADTTSAEWMDPIIKAVYDVALIGDRQILKYPYGADPIVSDRVRRAVDAAGCTGVEWGPMPTVDRR